ncbi:MAG TPA: hypothetical protein VGD67_18580 [Pseudonocardiaceae bacterium]
MTTKRALIALAATALAAAGLTAAAAPGSASPGDGRVCITNSPTPQYRSFSGHIGIGHELTHSEGRGFRIHGGYDVDPGVDWYYGHGAQYPDNDGWVRADRISC